MVKKGNNLQRLRSLEHRIRRRKIIELIPQQRLRDRQNPLEFYNSEEFKARYHMYKETAVYIITLIKDEVCCPIRRGAQVPPAVQICTVLRFYATASFQLTLSDLVQSSQSTVSLWIKRVSIAIAKHCKTFIRFPTRDQAAAVREGFYAIAEFPGVSGCIDCSHIEIKSPGGDNAELFRNRKGYFSINVQGICDDKMNFTNFVASWYGSAHDSRIFQNSNVFIELENGDAPGILLGDGGYPCLSYLMTPLTAPRTAAELRYNKSQIRTRNIIERVFGVWKRRFPCLLYLREKLSTALAIIVSTPVLHNITRQRRDLHDDDDDYDPASDNMQANGSSQNQSTLTGRAKQRQIIEQHFT